MNKVTVEGRRLALLLFVAVLFAALLVASGQSIGGEGHALAEGGNEFYPTSEVPQSVEGLLTSMTREMKVDKSTFRISQSTSEWLTTSVRAQRGEGIVDCFVHSSARTSQVVGNCFAPELIEKGAAWTYAPSLSGSSGTVIGIVGEETSSVKVDGQEWPVVDGVYVLNDVRGDITVEGSSGRGGFEQGLPLSDLEALTSQEAAR